MAEEDATMMDENHPFVERESKRSTKQWRITVGALIVVGVLLVLSILAIVGLAVALAVVSLADNSTSNSTTNCTTADCIELAATVLQNMDTSIDPCVDFYNYTCGGWNANHELPSSSGIAGVFQELDVNNKIKLKKLLEGDVDREVTAVSYLRNFYGHCMNLTNLTVLGAEPLYELLNQTGGWDLVGVHNATAPNWSISGADFRMSKLLGNPAFFSFGVGVDDKNSSRSITQLSQSGLSLPSPEAYLTPYYTTALANYITSVLTLLHPAGMFAYPDLLQTAEEIVQFEAKLAEIFVSSVALRDPVATYNLYQLDELHNSSQWSQFNWTEFAVEMFKMSNVSVDASLTVLVSTPSFFQNLTELYENTPMRILENYFKWQLAGSYVPYLGSKFLSVFYQFSQLVVGVGQQERYITCISVIEKVAPMPLARLFTDYILPPGTRDDITRLITSIKDAFVDRLTTNDWIDDTTRQRSIWKVGNITQLVAYPKEIDDDNYLLESSEALNSTEGQGYFTTAMQSQLNGALGNLELITKPVDKTEWEIAPTQVNAYYEPLYNQFVFLEGIMRAPFLVASWPDYFKLGAIGVVIGHELTHGFDDQGQQYNQDGILTPWWTPESVAEFKRRQTCFVDQYSEYSLFGYHINGNLTLGENIADNGGLKTAYQAYKNVSQNETQQTLPAIDLTPDQLFFVAFGQLWCSIFSPAYIATNLQVNPHSPGPYRVIGTVSNSEEFAAAFNCKAGAPMNPANKCDLW